jgi:hypothetical protein
MSTCYANHDPIFQPAMRLIASISNSNPAIVTTTFPHQYKSGTIVRLDIPEADGMEQANQLTGAIFVTGPITFTMQIDTSSFDPLVISMDPNLNTCAMVVPIGEVSEMLDASTRNILPFGSQ